MQRFRRSGSPYGSEPSRITQYPELDHVVMLWWNVTIGAIPAFAVLLFSAGYAESASRGRTAGRLDPRVPSRDSTFPMSCCLTAGGSIQVTPSTDG